MPTSAEISDQVAMRRRLPQAMRIASPTLIPARRRRRWRAEAEGDVEEDADQDGGVEGDQARRGPQVAVVDLVPMGEEAAEAEDSRVKKVALSDPDEGAGSSSFGSRRSTVQATFVRPQAAADLALLTVGARWRRSRLPRGCGSSRVGTPLT